MTPVVQPQSESNDWPSRHTKESKYQPHIFLSCSFQSVLLCISQSYNREMERRSIKDSLFDVNIPLSQPYPRLYTVPRLKMTCNCQPGAPETVAAVTPKLSDPFHQNDLVEDMMMSWSTLRTTTAVSREHLVVFTKYIEQAKEIEMDAVAKDGQMVMHFVSEHVENAGVHSGDAAFIHPLQDLDPTTVRQTEEVTAKIGNFIAKNNEIEVIECNVQAARSFPFVSKVTGIDAIEMATKVMLGLPVESYPDPGLPPDYVGVKVPQFSFSRLSGADPALGVEMASTEEVACFGRDKYEAYLKVLISTGIVPPK
ncbi:glutathione synthetase ATP-binding domain-like protein, partial [Rhizopogon salebrosus TDB-379]